MVCRSREVAGIGTLTCGHPPTVEEDRHELVLAVYDFPVLLTQFVVQMGQPPFVDLLHAYDVGFIFFREIEGFEDLVTDHQAQTCDHVCLMSPMISRYVPVL